MPEAMLEVERLAVTFKVPDAAGRIAREVNALAGVSLEVAPHEAVGVVGESGSGKSTLARAIVGLAQPSSGAIRIDGMEVPRRRGSAARMGVQMVFQDPGSTLNPFQSVGRNLRDVLDLWQPAMSRAERQAKAAGLLGEVGLGADLADRYPQSLSGGQRQRVAIARALAASPRLIVCDEPTSALDVSVQAQVLAVFAALKKAGQALLFISHNLAVVRQVCDRIVVMRRGEIVEQGSANAVIGAPRQAYTRALVQASPRLTDRGALLRAAQNPDQATTSPTGQEEVSR
jgi:peptide/nickel transport system ATP-binding protein